MKKPYSKNVFWNGILSIGLDVYVPAYNYTEESRESVKRFIVFGESSQEILCMIYSYFTGKGLLQTIDEMAVELLSDLESEALEWNPKAASQVLTRLMKCIWALNYLIVSSEMDDFPIIM